MKEKTSITLSKDVLAQVDQLAGSRESRSSFIERVLKRYVREHKRAALNARDLERINRAADRLNREAADVLEYQALDPDRTSEPESSRS
ncbi:MAG: ribbon-helix-helix protein, CopG family [Candidatus Acidiferrales bacterium]